MKQNLINILSNKKNLYIALTVLVFISGVISILVNRNFFRFYEDKAYVEISYSDSTSDKAVADLATINNLAQNNPTQRTLLFQNVTLYSVQTAAFDKINQLDADDRKEMSLEFTYYENNSLDVLYQNLVISFIIGGLTLLFVFLFIYNNLNKITLKQKAFLSTLYFAVLTLSVLFQLIIISIVSNIYFVKQLDLITITVTSIMVSIVFIYSLLNQLDRELKDKNLFKIFILNYNELVTSKKFYIIGFILLLNFGFGVNFVILSLLLISAIFIPEVVNRNLIYIFNYFLKWK